MGQWGWGLSELVSEPMECFFDPLAFGGCVPVGAPRHGDSGFWFPENHVAFPCSKSSDNPVFGVFAWEPEVELPVVLELGVVYQGSRRVIVQEAAGSEPSLADADGKSLGAVNDDREFVFCGWGQQFYVPALAASQIVEAVLFEPVAEDEAEIWVVWGFPDVGVKSLVFGLLVGVEFHSGVASPTVFSCSLPPSSDGVLKAIPRFCT